MLFAALCGEGLAGGVGDDGEGVGAQGDGAAVLLFEGGVAGGGGGGDGDDAVGAGRLGGLWGGCSGAGGEEQGGEGRDEWFLHGRLLGMA